VKVIKAFAFGKPRALDAETIAIRELADPVIALGLRVLEEQSLFVLSDLSVKRYGPRAQGACRVEARFLYRHAPAAWVPVVCRLRRGEERGIRAVAGIGAAIYNQLLPLDPATALRQLAVAIYRLLNPPAANREEGT
jgi:hypothetical protein